MNFVLHGHSVSTGITIGHAHLVSSARMEVAHYEVPQAGVEAEVARFDAAVGKVREKAIAGGTEGVVYINSDPCYGKR